jgi:hypothetical protein
VQCAGCPNTVEPREGRGRPRSYCEVCRPSTWEGRKLAVAARRAAEPVRDRAQVLHNGMLQRARRYSLPFDRDGLSVAWLEARLREHPSCECCGRAFDFARSDTAWMNPASPSCDRIVPEVGYVVGNVALLCWRCNHIKGDATADELEAVAAWLNRTRE